MNHLASPKAHGGVFWRWGEGVPGIYIWFFKAILSLRAEILHQTLTLIFKPLKSWEIAPSVFFPVFSLLSKHFSLMYLLFITAVLNLYWRMVLSTGNRTVFPLSSLLFVCSCFLLCVVCILFFTAFVLGNQFLFGVMMLLKNRSLWIGFKHLAVMQHTTCRWTSENFIGVMLEAHPWSQQVELDVIPKERWRLTGCFWLEFCLWRLRQ